LQCAEGGNNGDFEAHLRKIESEPLGVARGVAPDQEQERGKAVDGDEFDFTRKQRSVLM